jgi:hypothetical protein
MAIISTRSPNVEATVLLALCQLVSEVDGPAPEPTDTVIEVLRTIRSILHRTIIENRQLAITLSLVSEELDESETRAEKLYEIIERLTTVSYDDALEHATFDLMDAITSTGVADISEDGDLQFDSRAVLTKGDLKPVLREAIKRWVDIKAK